MRIAATLFVLTAAVPLSGKQPVVQRDATWVDTVQRGDMPASLRAQGTLSDSRTASLSLGQPLAAYIRPHQAVTIETREGIVTGIVSHVGRDLTGSIVPITVDIDGTMPESFAPGTRVVATIHMSTLKDTVYVTRPAFCKPDSEGTLFKLEPGGEFATRVKVRYGLYGHTPATVVEIREGLQPGDRVILSDMSAYNGEDRVRVE